MLGIHEIFKMKREFSGLSTAELADKMGCTRQAINDFEAGRSTSKRMIKSYNFIFDEYYDKKIFITQALDQIGKLKEFINILTEEI